MVRPVWIFFKDFIKGRDIRVHTILGTTMHGMRGKISFIHKEANHGFGEVQILATRLKVTLLVLHFTLDAQSCVHMCKNSTRPFNILFRGNFVPHLVSTVTK